MKIPFESLRALVFAKNNASQSFFGQKTSSMIIGQFRDEIASAIRLFDYMHDLPLGVSISLRDDLSSLIFGARHYGSLLNVGESERLVDLSRIAMLFRWRKQRVDEWKNAFNAEGQAISPLAKELSKYGWPLAGDYAHFQSDHLLYADNAIF